MTPEPSTALAWDSKSEREQTYWIAEHIMGWKKDEKGSLWHQSVPHRADFELEETYYEGDHSPAWEPTQNWNHWRQVEEKVMEDVPLGNRFLDQWNLQVWAFLRSELPERALALYLAYQALR